MSYGPKLVIDFDILEGWKMTNRGLNTTNFLVDGLRRPGFLYCLDYVVSTNLRAHSIFDKYSR